MVRSTKFGTDIHRHTVEFSKNTRTPPLETLTVSRSGATVPAYPDPEPDANPITFSATRRRSTTLHEDSGSNFREYQALPVQPRFPSLTCEDRVRVGVRVALTWNKLRELRTEHQIARSKAINDPIGPVRAAGAPNEPSCGGRSSSRAAFRAPSTWPRGPLPTGRRPAPRRAQRDLRRSRRDAGRRPRTLRPGDRRPP